ncbi:protein IQ-DOMAIN 32 isoform X2 [Magnolia sinica]|uniref:protein IQ-DOMAIN 32 isoform X2 n=1 Tax=Magnolia sinica TaxID=86752 RepID=UPI00265AC595|nr:protein IQ-DOMAIN 32 isoform X2 [Magnolia sinica]
MCGFPKINPVHTLQSKSSTDKRGWSFRKRSARHRVLSNTVISEPLSTSNKESPPTFTNECHAQTNSTVPGKISASQQTDETPHPFTSAEVNLKAADAPLAIENASDKDFTLQESIVIVIQTAIRGYLAQRALCKLKNVVKLQAAVRGLLVRRQAVGTLRCVQAIAKMQALVRARRVRLSIEGLAIQDKPDGKLETDDQRVKPLLRENSGTETNQAYYSTKKMLTNGFARQLLESTPKKKPIRIKCDPSRHDSAWNWLERWMSASSSDVLQPQQPQLSPDSQEQGENKKLDASEVRAVVQAEIISGSADVKSDMKETEMPLEGEENLITYNADDFEFQAYKPTSILDKSSGSAMEEDMEQHQVEDGRLGVTQESFTKVREVLKETPESSLTQVAESDATSQTALHTVSDEPEADSENPKRALKRGASEQLETEGKKFAFVTRKSSNPAFAAVQSKFEELSSTATSSKPIGSTYDEAAVESRLSSPPSQVDSVTKKMDISMTEDSISHDPKIQIGGSECGTELSISSTLDSPDRSEAEGGELAHERGAVEKCNSDLNGTADGEFNRGNSDAEAKNISYTLETLPNTSSSGIVQPTKLEEVNQDPIDSVAVVNFKQVKQEPSEQIASDMHVQLETVTEQPADNLSPEGSPRSHMTAPESHGTPSSQVSVSAKRDKSDTSKYGQKRSKSVGKRSLSNQNNDSAVRSSTEHLPKDSKNGKRRNSFDHEPRVSSSNSLPSYMQATESARAKAHANNSPKSSPDVLDKDVYMKKRHSLPVTNGKEGSPRMQRSMSQAQQNVKRNGTHSPQNSAERKWQR